MITDDLREEYGKSVTFNCENGDEAFTDGYVLWLEKQLLIQRVSKSVNCDHTGDEVLHQGNGFVYKTCADCGEDI